MKLVIKFISFLCPFMHKTWNYVNRKDDFCCVTELRRIIFSNFFFFQSLITIFFDLCVIRLTSSMKEWS